MPLPELDQITELISSLPGIGYKSATRIAFHILKQPPEYISKFNFILSQFHSNIDYCDQCSSIKSKNQHCTYCENPKRDHTILCVIEEPSDVFTIENTGDYFGLYHVLMGVLSPLDGVTPEDIRLSSLLTRVKENSTLTEIIVATNPTLEGDATANYIAEMLKDFKHITVSRLAAGLALGTQLEYTDSQVIAKSIRSRTPIEF